MKELVFSSIKIDDTIFNPPGTNALGDPFETTTIDSASYAFL